MVPAVATAARVLKEPFICYYNSTLSFCVPLRKGLESGTVVAEDRPKLKEVPYKPTAHLFYPNRLVDVPDAIPKFDGLPPMEQPPAQADRER